MKLRETYTPTMKDVNKENHIEFKRFLDDEMLVEVKKLFLEYDQYLNIDLDFQDFDTELITLPGK